MGAATSQNETGLEKPNEFDPEALLQPIREYKIVKKLGNGSHGEIFEARDIKTNELYALKINNENSSKGEWEKECACLSKVQHSPYICKFYERFVQKKLIQYRTKECVQYTEIKQCWCIVLKYYKKGDLKNKIEESIIRKSLTGNGTIADEHQIIEWMLQLCEGVYTIHNASMIHRDLNPKNIFLSDDNEIRIGDFGIAINKEIAKSLVGTLGYYAPDVWSSIGYYTAKADMYSIGSILLDLLTLTFAPDQGNLERIPKIPAHYSREWESIVRNLLGEARTRYSATQLKMKLYQLERSLPLSLHSLIRRRSSAASRAPTRQTISRSSSSVSLSSTISRQSSESSESSESFHIRRIPQPSMSETDSDLLNPSSNLSYSSSTSDLSSQLSPIELISPISPPNRSPSLNFSQSKIPLRKNSPFSPQPTIVSRSPGRGFSFVGGDGGNGGEPVQSHPHHRRENPLSGTDNQLVIHYDSVVRAPSPHRLKKDRFHSFKEESFGREKVSERQERRGGGGMKKVSSSTSIGVGVKSRRRTHSSTLSTSTSPQKLSPRISPLLVIAPGTRLSIPTAKRAFNSNPILPPLPTSSRPSPPSSSLNSRRALPPLPTSSRPSPSSFINSRATCKRNE